MFCNVLNWSFQVVHCPWEWGACLCDFSTFGWNSWNSCSAVFWSPPHPRIQAAAAHLNRIDRQGTRWQTYNELQSEGRGCEPAFPPLTTIATETVKWNSQVTVSRDSGARRGRGRGIRVYKQSCWNEFVFSRCQLPQPSLRLSVRSILFALACARAAAINFTECSEPLIRLANGACNLAAAETHSTLNCR